MTEVNEFQFGSEVADVGGANSLTGCCRIASGNSVPSTAAIRALRGVSVTRISTRTGKRRAVLPLCFFVKETRLASLSYAALERARSRWPSSMLCPVFDGRAWLEWLRETDEAKLDWRLDSAARAQAPAHLPHSPERRRKPP